jgi:hypothetical protein
MRSIDAIREHAFHDAMRRLNRKPAPLRKPRGKGGPSAVEQVFSERGRAFASLVIEAMNRDLITANDATSYLDIRLKHLHETAERIQ